MMAGVPEVNQMLSGWQLSPLNESRTACPIDTSHEENFDIQVHAEYNATPAHNTHMSTTDAAPTWFHVSGLFLYVNTGSTFAYFKIGNDATLGDYQNTDMESYSPEQNLMMFYDDATLMNRGTWQFKLEAAGSVTFGGSPRHETSGFRARIYYWRDEYLDYTFAPPTLFASEIPLHRLLSSNTGFSNSPMTEQKWCGEMCLPFAAGIHMPYTPESGNYFDARFRGYRDGTTPNF